MSNRVIRRKSSKWHSLYYYNTPDVVVACFNCQEVLLDSYGSDRKLWFVENSHVGEDVVRELSTHGSRKKAIVLHRDSSALPDATVSRVITFVQSIPQIQDVSHAYDFLFLLCSKCQWPRVAFGLEEYRWKLPHLTECGTLLTTCPQEHGISDQEDSETNQE